MKLAKSQNDFTKTISKEFFDKLRVVNNDNIRDLYNNSSSHFIVIDINKKKMVIIRDFYIMSRRIKGVMNFKFYYDNKIIQSQVKITEEQSLEDYKEESDMMKKIIKDEISKKRLYVKEA